MRQSFFRKWAIAILIAGIFACFIIAGIAGWPLQAVWALLAIHGVVMGHFALRSHDSSYAALWREFRKLLGPRTAIVGVVSARGALAYSYNDGPMRISFGLSAWRRAGGEVQLKNHEFRMRSSIFTRHKRTRQLQPYTVVELQVLGDPAARPGDAWSVSRTHVADAELMAIAAKLQEPVEISSPAIGKLLLDRAEDHFRKEIDWGSRAVVLELACEDLERPEKVLAVADALVRDQSVWQERADRYLGEHMFESALRWTEVEDEELTLESFLSRLVLKSISIYEDGFVEFMYEDGDVFGGHYVSLTGQADRGFDNSQLEG